MQWAAVPGVACGGALCRLGVAFTAFTSAGRASITLARGGLAGHRARAGSSVKLRDVQRRVLVQCQATHVPRRGALCLCGGGVGSGTSPQPVSLAVEAWQAPAARAACTRLRQHPQQHAAHTFLPSPPPKSQCCPLVFALPAANRSLRVEFIAFRLPWLPAPEAQPASRRGELPQRHPTSL